MLAEAAGVAVLTAPLMTPGHPGGDCRCSAAPPRCSDTGVPGCLSTVRCTALNPVCELIFCNLFMVPKIRPVQF